MSNSAVRRVVTGVEAGKTVFVSDGQPPTVQSLFPRHAITEVWLSEHAPPTFTAGSDDPTDRAWELEPPAGGLRWRIVQLPPDEEILATLDTGALRQQLRDRTGMEEDAIDLGAIDPDELGMHESATLDLVSVLSGAVWLRLSDGPEVELHPGDCVVQQGTRHAWRNRGTEPCVMSAVMISTRHP